MPKTGAIEHIYSLTFTNTLKESSEGKLVLLFLTDLHFVPVVSTLNLVE